MEWGSICRLSPVGLHETNGIFYRAAWIHQDIIDLPEFFSLRIADCHSSYLAGPLPSLQVSVTRLSQDLSRKEDAIYAAHNPKRLFFITISFDNG
jgi:hypothetical protein